MKMRWKLSAIIGLVAIISMAAVGISYAANGNPNPGDKSLCTFFWAESNDSGATLNQYGYNPLDPGDNGNDPTSAQVPGIACARGASNTASTSASYTNDTLTFNLNNGYPGYHPTIFFGISNQWPTPGIVTSIVLNNPSPSTMTLTLSGVSINQVIGSGTEIVGALDISEGAVAPGQSTSLSATIVVTQYTAKGQNKTSTTLSASPNPSTSGQTVVFSSSVNSTGNKGTPTGSVDFMEGLNVLGSGYLNSGSVTFSTDSLPVGSHNITANYSGDETFASSTSTTLVQVVRSSSRIFRGNTTVGSGGQPLAQPGPDATTTPPSTIVSILGAGAEVPVSFPNSLAVSAPVPLAPDQAGSRQADGKPLMNLNWLQIMLVLLLVILIWFFFFFLIRSRRKQQTNE